MRIPVIGQVFAGTAVPIDALPVTGFREIRPFRNARPGARFAAAPVCGDSLTEANIIEGDWVIFEMAHTCRPGQLVVAATPWGLAVKYFWPQVDGTIILKGANQLYEDQVWLADEVRVQGVVRRIERDVL